MEKFGHVASLSGSLVISVVPVALFSWAMPETRGKRGAGTAPFGGKDGAGDGAPPPELKLPDYGSTA